MTDAILKQLRECIPEFECIPGCTQCCGQVPWSKFEWECLSDSDRDRYDQFSFKCSFCDGGCTIHNDRPIVCRVVGVSEGAPCPRGVISKQMIDKEALIAITKEYQKHFFKEGKK